MKERRCDNQIVTLLGNIKIEPIANMDNNNATRPGIFSASSRAQLGVTAQADIYHMNFAPPPSWMATCRLALDKLEPLPGTACPPPAKLSAGDLIFVLHLQAMGLAEVTFGGKCYGSLVERA
jgi:hypothetical protein